MVRAYVRKQNEYAYEELPSWARQQIDLSLDLLSASGAKVKKYPKNELPHGYRSLLIKEFGKKKGERVIRETLEEIKDKKGIHVEIKMPSNRANEAVFEQEDRLGDSGITFDTGTSFINVPSRDWELDSVTVKPSKSEKKEYRALGEIERKLIRRELGIKPSRKHRIEKS